MGILKKIIIGTFILALIAGGIYVSWKMKTEKVDPIPVTEYKVKKSDIKLGFDADGNVSLPLKYYGFEISGKIKKINFLENDVFKKGDILAVIDEQDYMRNYDKSRTAYIKANLSLEESRNSYELQVLSEKQKLEELHRDLEKKKKEYEFAKEQYQNIQITLEAYDSARIAYENTAGEYNGQINKLASLKDNKNVEIAANNVVEAQQNLKNFEEDISKTKLIAMSDGKILSISNDEGDWVNSLSNSQQPISHFITFVDSEKIRIKANISEEDVKNVSLGQKVIVVFENLNSGDYEGKVTEIGSIPKVDANGLITYETFLELNKEEKMVKEGMTCTVNFILKEKKDILVIPNSYVKRLDGKQVVETKDVNGIISSKNIKTGLTDGKNVEVIEGLKAGESIITRDVK